MSTSHGVLVAIAGAILAISVLIAWVVFAPAQLGGSTAYVIVNGNSMEPGMKRGDLAVVRAADSYRIGDVVTYRHPEIGHVIHRIVAEENGRFTLQGDNNDFLDSYHPAPDEVVGRLWFHIPGAGRWFGRLQSPVAAGLVLFVAVAGLGAGAGAGRPARGKSRARRHPAAGAHGGTRMAPFYRNWQDTLTVLLGAGFGFALLAWVAFDRPAQVRASASVQYTQRGEFAYEAEAADGRIYDAGRATTGEPVYRRLSDAVAFTFTYTFDSDRQAEVAGTHQLVAELGDISGWRRTIELEPRTAFTGTTFTASGRLSLAELQRHIDLLESQSGVRNDRYTVTIRPQVDVRGAVGGVPFEATFRDAALPLALDRVQLRLDAPPTGAESVLQPRSEGALTAPAIRTNTVRLLFFGLPVPAARVIGVAGAGAAVVLAGAFAAALARRGWRDPADGLAEPVPVKVRGPLAADGREIIDVASFADLERLAERVGGIILQESRPGSHVSYVHDGSVIYRFAFDPGEYSSERVA